MAQKIPDFVNGLGDSGRFTADLAVDAIGDNPMIFRELIDLSFSQPYPTSMRTARVAQLYCEKNPAMILPYIDEIIEKMGHSKVEGVRRSFLKVINDHLGPEKISDPGLLVQRCFEWLASPSESVSVRYHCLGILGKLCVTIPDLYPELHSVVQFILDEGSASPGLKCQIKRFMAASGK